jgi:hypothetical protein
MQRLQGIMKGYIKLDITGSQENVIPLTNLIGQAIDEYLHKHMDDLEGWALDVGIDNTPDLQRYADVDNLPRWKFGDYSELNKSLPP